MKNKILTFIIGALVGAILTISIFIIYFKNVNININRFDNNLMERPNERMGNPPEKPQGKMKKENSNEI